MIYKTFKTQEPVQQSLATKHVFPAGCEPQGRGMFQQLLCRRPFRRVQPEDGLLGAEVALGRSYGHHQI